MKRLKYTFIILAAAFACQPCNAETDADDLGAWLSAGVEKKIAKGLDTSVEAEYRLQDNMSENDRWALGASVSYRLYRNEAKTFDLKASLGYKYMNTYTPENIKYRDADKLYNKKDVNQQYPQYNLDEDYWLAKHRLNATLAASYTAGRFKFSLRERVQLTMNDSVAITEYKYRYSKILGGLYVDEDDGTETEYKGTDVRSTVLRSRLSASYDIPGCKLNPFISAELFSDMENGLSREKIRYQAGVDYTFKKQHNFELYYAYQRESDGDEPGGHIIGFGYTFEF